MSHFRSSETPASAFPSAPQVDLGFEPDVWVFRNDGATAIDVSFNGSDIHVTLPVSGRETVLSRAKKAWIQDGAGTGTLEVRANNGAAPS